MKAINWSEIGFDWDRDSGMWLVTQNKEVIGAFSAREQAEEFLRTLKEWDAQSRAKVL